MPFAILIGINSLNPDKQRSPLKGCVHDVQEISKKLKASLASVRIQAFTASTTEVLDSIRPAEDPEFWPTYENIVSCIEQVCSEAQSGDSIYIHYSGHGTAIPPQSIYSNWATGDLALVLLHGSDAPGIRYLHGIELAYLLRDMVKKGLMVTLVLDCCVSGCAMRNEDSVRYLSYEPEIDAAFLPNIKRGLNPDETTRLGGYREASMLPNWLADPDGYAILTACGPTEQAYEVKFDEGPNHGALSYFLLTTFDILGGIGGRMREIYHHIRVRVRESRWHRRDTQNPMLYGNKNLLFLGCVVPSACSGDIAIIKKMDDTLQLQAGEAHGICNGDRFDLRPVGGADVWKQRSVTARAAKVSGLTSVLELEAVPNGVETGWLARALTRQSLRQILIGLEVGDSNQEAWQIAIKARESLVVHEKDSMKPGNLYSFVVALNDDSDYEIRDESNKVIIQSSSKLYDPMRTTTHLLDKIYHLALFKLVQNLSNKSLEDEACRFRNSFSVQLARCVGKDWTFFDPGCLLSSNFKATCSHPECAIEVRHGQKITLVVRNKGEMGDATLCLYLYDMGSRWQIQDALCGNHEIIPPSGANKSDENFPNGTGGKWRKNLHMKVPNELIKEGQDHCEDTIKIFLTVQPTSFTLLELPNLGDPMKQHEAPLTIGQRDGRFSDDWAALNFRVRTLLK